MFLSDMHSELTLVKPANLFMILKAFEDWFRLDVMAQTLTFDNWMSFSDEEE